MLVFSFRVDSKPIGLSQEFITTAAELQGYINVCDKERKNRNPVKAKVGPFVTLAGIQLVQAVETVSGRQ